MEISLQIKENGVRISFSKSSFFFVLLTFVYLQLIFPLFV